METGLIPGDVKMEEINQSLGYIEQKLDAEVQAKQNTINRYEKEIERLHVLLEDKERLIRQTGEQLTECAKTNEGNRQLINKLLNDIDRLNQDIEWFKRTYERRSLAGVIKDRFKFLIRRR
jgi:peptidoglycan hydrolase CwlO-like protein